MDRTLASHGVLALVAAAAAGVAAFGPSDSGNNNSESSVVLVPGAAADISAIEFREDRFDVKIARVTPGEERLQVTVTKKARPPKKPEGEDAPPAEPASPDVKVYPGSKRAEKLIGEMGPLTAVRSFGKLGPDRLLELGLEGAKDELVISAKGKETSVLIGNATYGSGDRYAMTNEAGEVYLLKASLISTLRNGASALLERRALPVNPDSIKRVEIESGSSGRELSHRFPEDKAKAFFADPAVPDEKLETASNWIDRVLKMRVADVNADKPSGAPRIVIKVFNGKSALGSLSMWEPGDKHAIAVSTLFERPIKIAKANAEAVLRDVEEVLGEGR